MNLIVKFLDAPSRNEWIDSDSLRAYVRKGRHIIGGVLMNTFDVAAVTVAESKRGRGVFTSWLADVEDVARDRGLVVRVESIHELRLVPFLTSRGYLRVPNTHPLQVDMYFPLLSLKETP